MRAAVRRSGLSRREVLRCMERGFVNQPFTESSLEELRRIRRLQDLGVNLAGIEIVLRMRRRITHLQAELARRNLEWSAPVLPRGDDRWHRLLAWEPDAESE